MIARTDTELEGDAKRADGRPRGRASCAGVTDNPVAAVGVERTGTEPSQVSWYRDHDLSSVDDVDLVAGQAALVFALSGATGSFGTGPQAEALLPGAESLEVTAP